MYAVDSTTKPQPQQLLREQQHHHHHKSILFSLIAHFFLLLNNIPLSRCTTGYLPIHLLKNIFIASKYWQL